MSLLPASKVCRSKFDPPSLIPGHMNESLQASGGRNCIKIAHVRRVFLKIGFAAIGLLVYEILLWHAGLRTWQTSLRISPLQVANGEDVLRSNILHWQNSLADSYIVKKMKYDARDPIPILGFAFAAKMDYVVRLLCCIDYPIRLLVLIQNSYLLETQTFVDQVLSPLLKGPLGDFTRFIHMPYNLGCAAGWNHIIRSNRSAPGSCRTLMLTLSLAVCVFYIKKFREKRITIRPPFTFLRICHSPILPGQPSRSTKVVWMQLDCLMRTFGRRTMKTTTIILEKIVEKFLPLFWRKSKLTMVLTGSGHTFPEHLDSFLNHLRLTEVGITALKNGALMHVEYARGLMQIPLIDPDLQTTGLSTWHTDST